jgi:hypothetical protein
MEREMLIFATFSALFLVTMIVVADFWVRASVEIDGVKIRHTRRSALCDETAGARMAP